MDVSEDLDDVDSVDGLIQRSSMVYRVDRSDFPSRYLMDEPARKTVDACCGADGR